MGNLYLDPNYYDRKKKYPPMRQWEEDWIKRDIKQAQDQKEQKRSDAIVKYHYTTCPWWRRWWYKLTRS